MTEKVKVTQEQFDWLEKYKTEQQIDFAIDIQLHRKRPDSPIVDWKLSEVARALYVGYEVEPKFKVGDWVIRIDEEVFLNGERVVQVDGVDGVYLTYAYDIGIIKDLVRPATDKEVTREKERRKWAEIKTGDVVISEFYETPAIFLGKLPCRRMVKVKEFNGTIGFWFNLEGIKLYAKKVGDE